MFSYVTHYVTAPERTPVTAEKKAQTLEAIRDAGIVSGEKFSITDIPLISFTTLVDPKLDLKDFAGRIRFGNNNNLNSGQYYPFHCDMVRLSIIKSGPQKIGSILVGDNVYLASTTIVSYERVRIGDNVVFGPMVTIMDCDGHSLDREKGDTLDGLVIRPVEIMDNAWIAMGAVILKGVTIGRNSVVGINSVVTKSVPDNCVAAGNPAVIVKKLK